MTDTLPISIQVSKDLSAEVEKISAISNKLAAQLNFHTMAANWYSDEANILLINFFLVTISEFSELAKHSNDVDTEVLADDVRLSSKSCLLDCHVAITTTESALIKQQPKLLSGYLAKKLTKVLNLIADREKLMHV